MAPKGLSFPKSARLTKSAELIVVLKTGRRVRSEHLELRGLASLSHHGRVGVIVPKHRHSAVERNRLKRRLREIIRLHVLWTMNELQLVIRTSPGAYDASFEQLRVEILRGVDQLQTSR
ncbi:MAG: ribonuclease P protein component [Nitrospiraceae bacterium]|nr:ribonuclease P protein component [Nitrospiraceae bacterium]